VPCGAARIATTDVEIGGTVVPEGSPVLGMIISANRDGSVFDRPDELDLGREPNRHLAFAFGAHYCLGNQLARLEGRVALRALVDRFPNMRLAVPKDELAYKPTQSLRGLRHLPLVLGRPGTPYGARFVRSASRMSPCPPADHGNSILNYPAGGRATAGCTGQRRSSSLATTHQEDL
jgi:Cytochrome P450